MGKVFPDGVIPILLKYDSSYKGAFDKLLIQLNMHTF